MLYIQCKNKYYAVYTSSLISENKVVMVLSDKIKLKNPTRSSIQIDSNNHIEDPVGRFINHSCNPTCKIHGLNIISVKDLNPDDEITFDYTKNETYLASPFVCIVCNKLIKKAPAPCLSGDKK